MIGVLFLIVAIILFIWAAAIDSIHATAGDLGLLGLAAFAAAHLPWGDYIGRRE